METLPTFSSAFHRTLWVQAELRSRGKSFASIARDHGWSRGAVRYAMSNPSDPQERAIAAALGVEQRALFSERYDLFGHRLHRVVKDTDPGDSGNVKTDEAA